MKTFSQVEGILYNHYRKKETIDKLNSQLKRTRNRIDIIKETLKECDFTLDVDIKGIDYSQDKVQSNSNISSVENELLREESKLERELKEEIKYKFNLKRRARNIQKQIDNVEVVLEQLPLNYVKIIELLYKDKLTYRATGYILYCTHVTVRNHKKRIIEILMKELN